ncbi:MAG TPA: nicotinate phosphoribosyltransferase [Elusimicrobia bacterium]|nr:nicotinate phosphoribosyltransferase [Elusimicrobiota bacterium]HBT63015.1 nicotinate phosphoribosyltransferase [Elusimicrobiota bacterium]
MTIQEPSALATDFYQLTMAAAYFANGLHQAVAEFELSVRSLPPRRSCLIAAGLQTALDFLAAARFSPDDVDYLRGLPALAAAPLDFFTRLRDWRFTGDAWAVPEGTAVFAAEPLLRLRAPLIEGQIVETFLLSVLGFETMVATKAARLAAAARGRGVVDFGARRTHGFAAAPAAARAAYIGGCIGTSNVAAGRRFGIPLYGTMAHSFVMAFPDEDSAFRAFLKLYPDTATLVIDTYDTIAAARLLARNFGARVPAVRLDSGDLLELSRKVRGIFDAAGMAHTRIIASNELDEYRIAVLLDAGAPIDAFGVGTELASSTDAPSLSTIYKLVSLSGCGRVKLSPGKSLLPHAKQTWRRADDAGIYREDIVALSQEAAPNDAWRPLLRQVMTSGEPTHDGESIAAARARAAEEIRRLPPGLLLGYAPSEYPVRPSARLQAARRELEGEIRLGMETAAGVA